MSVSRRRRKQYRFDNVQIPSDTVHQTAPGRKRRARPRSHAPRWRFPVIRMLLAVALLGAIVFGGSAAYRALIGPFELGWLTIPSSVKVVRPAFLNAVANAVRGPVRVGVQIGHLDASDQPEELANLRFNFGGHANGVDEVAVNTAIGFAVRDALEAQGFIVDVLPATIPRGYRADVMVSIHADSTENPARYGYKSAHFDPPRNPYEALLKVEIDRQFLGTAGRADDDHNVSGNMLHYYAFDHRRFYHAVDPRTPALLIEAGYISNRDELAFLQQEHSVAALIADGIVSYLRAIGRVWP